jgi:LacI family transcriptional regulator
VIMVESLGREFDSVTFDGYDGIRQIVDHLVQRGRRRIAFIAGHFDARQQGYMDALQAHGLSADPEWCIHVPYGLDGWTRDLGHTGAEQLLRLPKRPDAIVCASDLIAIGAIQRLHQYGLRVPDDMAVTGFDDITESAFTVPPLTTVHVHKQLMGALAAERIVKRFENPEEIPLLIQTPTQLVIRQSS